MCVCFACGGVPEFTVDIAVTHSVTFVSSLLEPKGAKEMSLSSVAEQKHRDVLDLVISGMMVLKIERHKNPLFYFCLPVNESVGGFVVAVCLFLSHERMIRMCLAKFCLGSGRFQFMLSQLQLRA